MVSLSQVIASNQRIASTFPPGLVAVFVGGTSGVGEYTVKAFAKYVSKPKVYIVGRSQEAADRIVGECKKLNPGGTFEFIKADVSLLKGVDDVCRQLKSKETAINLLFESQGGMGFAKSRFYFPYFNQRTTVLILRSNIRGSTPCLQPRHTFTLALRPELTPPPSKRQFAPPRRERASGHIRGLNRP